MSLIFSAIFVLFITTEFVTSGKSLQQEDYPIPDHQKIESNEESQAAATVCHQGREGKCLLLLLDKDRVTGKYWQ